MSFKNGVDTTYRNKDRVRGGAGDFTWDQLKGDKLAAVGEYYIGRSQMCENIWYGKERVKRTKEEDRHREVADIKAQEQEMMMQAMGIKPTKRKQTELTAADEKALLSRSKPSEGEHLGLGLNIHVKKASAQHIANTGIVPDDLRKSSTYDITAESLKGNLPTTSDSVPTTEHLIDADQIVDGVNYTAISNILKGREREKKDKKEKKKDKKEKKKKKKKDKKHKRKESSRKKKRRRSSSTSSSYS